MSDTEIDYDQAKKRTMPTNDELRALNLWVAEKNEIPVVHRPTSKKFVRLWICDDAGRLWLREDSNNSHGLWSPATDLNQAWKYVVPLITDKNHYPTVRPFGDGAICNIHEYNVKRREPIVVTVGDNPALAICRGAREFCDHDEKGN